MIDAVSSVAAKAGKVTFDSLASSPVGGAAAAPGASFGDTLAQVASSAVQTLTGAEATSISGLQGKATVQQVVNSVMSAQETLQTALSIRDKAVNAFDEITKMAI